MKLPLLAGWILFLAPLWAAPAARAGEDEPAKIRTIVTNGERVDLGEHVVKGKYTLFEFYADWSPECHKYGVKMDERVKSSDAIVLRRINIMTRQSPVAKQYGIKSVPHYKLYDQAGQLFRESSPAARKNASSRTRQPAPRKAPPPARAEPAVPKVLTISRSGELVDVGRYMAKGKKTVVEFYADW